ncbi:MAG: hypothetical protein QM840_13035, partial [Verrucomicrobiota bacterium]|nr:hypothetical protein [Verrucomicrobiota bacterium]
EHPLYTPCTRLFGREAGRRGGAEAGIGWWGWGSGGLRAIRLFMRFEGLMGLNWAAGSAMLAS